MCIYTDPARILTSGDRISGFIGHFFFFQNSTSQNKMRRGLDNISIFFKVLHDHLVARVLSLCVKSTVHSAKVF